MRSYDSKAVEWQQLVNEVITWANETFGTSQRESLGKIRHIRKECDELIVALQEGDREKIAQEFADILILALHFAHIEDLDPTEVVRKKFEIVKTRKWNPPDADGVIEHVK